MHPPSTVTGTAAAVRRAAAPKLRWYQGDLKQAANDAWALWGPQSNVLAVMPTGAGKTVFFASVIADHTGASCAIAHRRELVGQISMALAKFGIRHRIIAPPPVIRAICAEHLKELGVCFYDPTARAGVVSVQSLTDRVVQLEAKWIAQVTLWVIDECHHGVVDTGWGKVLTLFPNAKGLGVTATPIRADGRGLGIHAQGLFHTMVVGPTMRELIDWGYLCDYRIVVAETHIDMTGVSIGADGDYVLKTGKGKKAVRASTLVGDVVSTYLKWTPNMLGICFTSDVETAEDIAAQFRAKGVTAEAVDGKTDAGIRDAAMRRFKARETMVLVNCELYGEGTDVPGVEVVMLARKTMSFAMHAQQFGRGARLNISRELMQQWDDFTVAERRAHIAASPKPRFWILDHAGNVCNPLLGLPDAKNDWSLDDTERKSSGPTDVIPNRSCLNPVCLSPYPRSLPACPYCHEKPKPTPGTTGSAAVDGDMTELDDALLAAMRGAVAAVAMPNDEYRQQPHIRNLPAAWAGSNVKKHDAHRTALLQLQDSLAWWAGEHRAHGRTDAEVYRRFYLMFGIDWLTCQAQDRESMEKLTAAVSSKLTHATTVARMQAQLIQEQHP
jgi:superfamily II DNA or RNA helicase